MSIKVLVISNYRDYHSTRPEASIFIGLAKVGFQVYVMTYKDSKHVEEFEKSGIKVIDFHPEKKFDKSEIQTIKDVIIKEKIDILHLFNSASIINGIQAAKRLPVKVVLYRGYCGNIHWYDPTAYFKFLHPRVDKIICNSRGVEEYIQNQLFFDKRKTVTINKGHNVEWYSGYDPYDIRKELGIPSDSFLLINVSNNRKMKGINYLLKAFNDISNDLPIHLLLVGRDMDNKQNLNILNQGSKRDKVHFFRFSENVLNIVSSSNVFVLPSIKGESLTKAVIEAMSLSVTPIITDISGNKELVVNNESGLIVLSKNCKKLRDAILKLYEDQSFCRELGKNSKKRIEAQLNHKQTIFKTKKLYENLCEKQTCYNKK